MSKQKALSLLEKEYKTVFRRDFGDPKPIEVISTGSLLVDKVTGVGGIPKGRITEITGNESVGKTTLALSVAKNAQKQGLTVAYLDYEHALDPDYVSKLGIDTRNDTFLVFQPHDLEEGDHIVNEVLLPNQAADLIIIDSIAAMNPRELFEKTSDQTLTIGAQARGINKFLLKATKLLNEHNITMLVVNQLQTKISTGFGSMTGPQEEAKGGRALKYAKSLALNFTRIATVKGTAFNDITGKNEQMDVYNKIKVKCTKNKVASPYKSAEIFVRFGMGFDNYLSVIEGGSATGVVQKSGTTFSYQGTKIGVGVDAAARALAKPEMQKLYEDIVSNLKWDALTAKSAPTSEEAEEQDINPEDLLLTEID